MTDKRDADPLIAGLIALSGVNEVTRKCSVCGKTSNKGYGVDFRKDWQTGKWYCFEHRPWATDNLPPPGEPQ
jgi:hypothetical protein